MSGTGEGNVVCLVPRKGMWCVWYKGRGYGVSGTGEGDVVCLVPRKDI